jgi:hypothetical protein
MAIIIPVVPQDPERHVPLRAPGTVPYQDQTAEQMQRLSQAVLRTGAIGHQIGEEWLHGIRSAQAKQLYNQAAEKQRNRVTAYKKRLGFDAVTGLEDEIAGLDEDLRVLGDTPDNDPVVRQMLEPELAKLRSGAQREIESHGQDQLRIYQIGESKARKDGAFTDYVRTMGTPEADGHRAVFLSEVDDLADLAGWAPDSAQRKQLRLEGTTQLHAAQLESLMGQDPVRAAEYLNANRGEIEGGKAIDLQQQIGRAQVQGHAIAIRDAGARVADKLTKDLSRTDSTGVAVVDTDAAINQLQEAFEAGLPVDVRDEAQRRIEHTAKQQRERRDGLRRSLTWTLTRCRRTCWRLRSRTASSGSSSSSRTTSGT